VGKIIVSLNASLDGVVQEDEDFRHGGWYRQSGGEDLGELAEVQFAEALGAAALLLGRRTDGWFAARWLSRSGELADRLNAMPKYVVSATAAEPRWANATVLKGDVPDEVVKLKQELDGEIVVYGSIQLVRALMEHGLVDELRLIVFPVVLGVGVRLFGETDDKMPLRLLGTRTVGAGLVSLTYEFVRKD
jgi:dihydrofolate reductase